MGEEQGIMDWTGVFPALTTPFDEGMGVDHAFLARHANWMAEAGCRGLVALGSLGEGATLDSSEKAEILRTCVEAVGARIPVVAGVSALSTAGAVRLAEAAEQCGCRGLMVLPPYVYSSDWREMKAHVGAVLRATRLPALLYNNPLAYGVDFVPEQIAELAGEEANLEAVKESSADTRRVTGIRALLGERLQIMVGVDDSLVEGVRMGAVGWVAGLVNAFPGESVRLFEWAREGRTDETDELYRWFLPLLRLDTGLKFVQLIKLAQQEAGMGSERVRPPRLSLDGEERRAALEVIRTGLAARPRQV